MVVPVPGIGRLREDLALEPRSLPVDDYVVLNALEMDRIFIACF